LKIPRIFSGYKPRQKKISFFMSIGLSVAMLIMILIYSGYNYYVSEKFPVVNPFFIVDKQIVDSFFMRRFISSDDPPVSQQTLSDLRLIEIDDRSLGTDEFPEWPIPRSRYGILLERLKNAGAKTIGMDIILDDKSSEGGEREDEYLAEVLRDMDNVFLPCYFYASTENVSQEFSGLDAAESEYQAVKLPYKPFYEALNANVKDGESRVGLVSVQARDVIRFMRLSRSIKNKSYFALSMALAAHYMGIPQDQLKDYASQNYFQMGKTRIPLYRGKLLINYLFPPGEETYIIKKGHNVNFFVTEYSILDVFQMTDEEMEAQFKDKIVLIGATAVSAQDTKLTPFGNVPGVFAHANMILSFIGRKFIKPASLPFNLCIILIVGFVVGFAVPRLSPAAGGLFTILFCFIYYQFAYWRFANGGIIVFIAAPIFAAFFGFIIINIYHLVDQIAARTRISKMFREFAPLPSPLIEHYVEEMGGDATVGGKMEHLTILFADIRGYTQLSETMQSKEVMDLLNDYHQAMGEVFQETGGVIFTYIGDAQLVVYGLEQDSKVNHAAAAIRAGLMMQDRLEQLRKKWEKENKKIFEVGVGICTGELSIGVVGSKQLKQYTVIGDTVNVASRIQGMSRELASPTLIHERTYLMARHCIEAEALRPVKLKGKQELVNVYRVKKVFEIKPYPGDEIKDLDEEVRKLHLKRQEALEKIRMKKEISTGREERQKRTGRDKEKDDKKETEQATQKSDLGGMEISILEPIEEKPKGETVDEK